MWRPDDWEEIKPKTSLKPTSGEKSSFIDGLNLGVERGADAILEYLSSQKHQDWLATPTGMSCSGKWVFIPDDDTD